MPVKRDELVKYAAEEHERLGGKNRGDSTASVKKALNGLVDEEKVSHPTLGYYSPRKEGSEDETDTDKVIAAISETAEQDSTNSRLVPDEIIGGGDESVYVYYQASDRKLAELEGSNVWPCKIGFTAGNLSTRVFAQFPATGVARLPVVGLVIRTDDGHGLERAIHFALDSAEVRIDDAIGSEWFDTSIDRIKAWYENHIDGVNKLRKRE
jgi:Meiotically up-regulated gene 113